MKPWFKGRPQSENRVGVTIGAKQVTLAHIETRAGRPHLLNCRSAAFDSEKSAPLVLARLVKECNLEGKRCNFVLSAHDYNLLLVEAPDVQASELRAAARWKVKDLLDGKPEDMAIDLFHVPAEAYRGRKMIYVVVSPNARIRELVAMIEASGLELESIDIPELALRNLAHQFAGDSRGVAFMELRESGSTMNITRGGDLFLSRRINSKLDANVMNSPQWESTFSRLVLEIQRSLDYYESQMSQDAIEQLILIERRYDGPALAQALDAELIPQVQILDIEQSLSSDVRLPPELQEVACLAVGATLRAFALESAEENNEVTA